MLTFAVIGVIGLLLLAISMALGEILDLFDGILSGTAIGAGATLFGAGGFLVLINGGPSWLSFVVAISLGLTGILSMWFLSKKIRGIADEQPHEVVGLQGIATTSITKLIGKVQLSHPGEINQRLAISDNVIEEGTPVTVVAHMGDRIKVAPTQQAGE